MFGCKHKPRNSTDLRCHLVISQPSDIGYLVKTRPADRDSCTSKKVSFPIRGFWFFNLLYQLKLRIVKSKMSNVYPARYHEIPPHM